MCDEVLYEYKTENLMRCGDTRDDGLRESICQETATFIASYGTKLRGIRGDMAKYILIGEIERTRGFGRRINETGTPLLWGRHLRGLVIHLRSRDRFPVFGVERGTP